MNSKIYFDSFSLKEKILLYLIPLMIIALYLIYNPKKQIIIDNKINNTKSQLEIIKYFEKRIKSNKINLESMNFTNNKLNLKIYSNINKIIKFINITYLEYEILSYHITESNKIIYLDISFYISNNSYYKQRKIKKYNLKNPFVKIKSRNTKLTKAIIGEFVLIDNKWYKKGDSYKNKIINNIYKDKIELKQNNKISILRIFDE